MMSSPVRLCVVVTAPLNLQSLYRAQFSYLISEGFSVTAIAGPGNQHDGVRRQGARSVAIPMERSPSVLNDLVSTYRLWRFFLRNRFDVISVSTPKASLLGAIAARLSGQRNVIYMVRGRAYENMSGIKRSIYELLDRLVCKIAKRVQFISRELQQEYARVGICPTEKAVVLGAGSSNGVDLSVFCRERYSQEDKLSLKHQHGLDPATFVFLFCGRIRAEKGVNELIDAFREFRGLAPNGNVALLIVGDYEEFDPISENTRQEIASDKKIIVQKWASDVESYFAIADVFLFPTHREGFGNVAIEASAMGVPIVAFDVVGCRESVVSGSTGFLCRPFSTSEFAQKMLVLYENRGLRAEMGRRGAARIHQEFDSQVVWARLVQFYREMAAA